MAAEQTVTADFLTQFARDALDHAIATKGRFRGLQQGVAVIPTLVGSTVEPAAATYAEHEILKRFAAFAWPTAVDLSTRTVLRHDGPVFMGGVYAKWMREKTSMALPDPQP